MMQKRGKKPKQKWNKNSQQFFNLQSLLPPLPAEPSVLQLFRSAKTRAYKLKCVVSFKA